MPLKASPSTEFNSVSALAALMALLFLKFGASIRCWRCALWVMAGVVETGVMIMGASTSGLPTAKKRNQKDPFEEDLDMSDIYRVGWWVSSKLLVN